MAFDISEFKANALRNGLVKNNLFICDFSQSALPNRLMWYASNVTLPAVTMQTTSVRRYGYGPTEEVAFRPNFSDTTMTFYVDNSDQNVVSSIMGFLDTMVPFMEYNDINDSSSVAVVGNSGDATPYEVAYKDDYKFDLTVYIYNEVGGTVLVYTLRDCVITSMSSGEVSWDGENTIMRVNANLKYTDYRVNIANPFSGSNLGLLSNLTDSLGLPGLSSTLNAIQVPTSVGNLINVNNAATLFGL
jgi:hypothetical protein